MRIAVIGSGFAGLACAKGLIERGLKVEMLDVGEELDDDRQQLRERLRNLPLEQWEPDSIRRIKENPSFRSRGVPRRRYFGSEFVFSSTRKCLPLNVEGSPFAPTFAKGGYSIVWGASVLPTADRDLEDWPFARSALDPYYRKVLQKMPMSADPSPSDTEFPLFTSHTDPIPFPNQCADFLAKLRKRESELAKHGVRFERSRLAVLNSQPGINVGCNSCGLCLYGCVPDAIYSSVPEISDLQAGGYLRYRPGIAVQEVRETANTVRVRWQSVKHGAEESEGYEAVFLAAGALNTTRLLLRATASTAATLLDSQKFIMPLLNFSGTQKSLEDAKPSFAGVFLDICDPALDPHWIHGQIYAVNAPMLARLGIDMDRPRQLRRTILRPMLDRLMLAWIGLHSSHSGHLEVTLDERADMLHVKAVSRPETAQHIRRVARKYWQFGMRVGAAFLLPAMQIAPPGAGHHIGGSFPMRSDRHQRTDTDIWGRPAGHRRVFAVDSSIFPSVPATTVALTAMANAWRIAAEAPLPELSV